MLPILTITTGEFAPTHRRAAAIGLMGAGLPLGSAVGGAGAALLMSKTGWQSAFVLGAVLTALVCLLVVASVPETPDYLASKNTPTAQRRLADLLAKMGIDPELVGSMRSSDAAGVHDTPTESGGISLRSWQMVVTGLLFVCVVTTYYFSTMWLPKLLVLAGMSADSGFSGVLLLTLGAAASGILIAVLSTRYSLFILLPVFALLSATFLAVFSVVSNDLTFALVVAPVLGLFQSATGIGLYALVPQLFGPSNRSAAMGLGIGLSRIAMIVMPLGVGILIDRSWTPESLFQLMILPTLMTAALIILLRRDQRRRAARGVVAEMASSSQAAPMR
ncbi:MFS transporter [Prescottella equi]|uniref:MFS transporter n=1 Tax=Rhodococcus hoagii TaxID=43767 RepID=UPI00301BCF21